MDNRQLCGVLYAESIKSPLRKENSMKRRILSAIIAGSLIASTLSLSACQSEKSLETTDLMTGIKAASHETVKPDDAFKSAYGNFSVELLKKCFDGKSNTLISPLSVSSALTMTANGANGQTKDEMEKVLGSGMPLDELNKYLSSFSGSLTSGEDFKLKNANSIWFIKDNNFNVNNEFLQTNADFYHAEIYKRAYNSEIVNNINNWVSEHTDGMIDKLLDNGDALSNIALINATAFDAKWENYYYDNFVEDETFTDANGNEQSITMLISEESEYINGDNCTGFIKKYKGGKYGFAAILPDSNVSISDFVGSLNGDKLFKMLQNAESTNVVAKMPKFEYEYSAELSEALKALGMPTAFSDSADFSGISGDKLLISDVLHKTKISVTKEGTRAVAATGVVMSAAPDGDKQVILNRPFMYMILDNETMLPLFAGVYTGI